MDFILLLILILAVFFTYSFFSKNNLEKYENYKPITVQPSPTILDPLTLNYVTFDNTLNQTNINKFSQVFPFIPNKIEGSLPILNLVNENKNQMGLVSIDILTDQIFHHKMPLNNIRVICGFSVVKPYLLVRTDGNINSWKDLENKRITFGWPSMGWERIGNYFLNFARIKNINVVDGYWTFEEITEGFKNGEIDAFFCVLQDPNINLYEMISNGYCFPLSFDFNIEVVNSFFPTFEESYIDLTNYSISALDSVKTYKIKNCLICHKDLSEDIVGQIINSILNSQLLFKSTISDEIIPTDINPDDTVYSINTVKEYYNNISMLDFNPNDIFFKIEIITQHSGVIKYLTNIGIYTTNNSPYCAYLAGAGKCDFSKLGEFRLLY